MAIDGGDGGYQYAVGGEEREKAAGEGGIGGGLVDPGGGRRAAGRGGGGGGGRGRDVVEAEDAADEGGEGDREEGAALVGGMAPEEGVDGGAGGGDVGRRHGGQDGGGQVLGPVLRIHRLGFWERGRSGEREAFGVRRFKTRRGGRWGGRVGIEWRSSFERKRECGATCPETSTGECAHVALVASDLS